MKLETGNRGFTLIELLIVTVVIVTLMGVVFRLAGTGGENRARAITIERMQRLENALSGYYAAYGSYPPVPLQGRSRSIYKSVDGYGRQENGTKDSGVTDFKSSRMLAQIEAACRAQPLSVSWPPSKHSDLTDTLDELSKGCNELCGAPYKSGFKVLNGVGTLKWDSETDWRGQADSGEGSKGVQLFEFGLLSFLFPRYLFMMDNELGNFYQPAKGRETQWSANNQIPCRLDNGAQYKDWDEVRKFLGAKSANANPTWEAGMISNLTSQAVCARWMPNFKGIVTTVDWPKYRYFFGVDILDGDRPYLATPSSYDVSGFSDSGGGNGDSTLWHRRLRVYSQSAGASGGSQYILFSMTVCDGWGHEFYYYSEPPYQSYRLWSAGPNKATFPPWYDLDTFSGTDLKQIHKLIKDDIVHLSN